MHLSALWQRLCDRFRARPAPHPHARGAAAERAAARYLRRHGYRLLDHNLRVAGGEIDLLAVHDECLVIVEVRSYKATSGFRPRATLSADKQHRLRRMAQELHKRPRWRDRPVRIDLVEVQTDARDRAVAFDLLRGI
jgi:putative endonuclease